ncbi:Ref family recombination enhancement nuclease [Stenotrophomonas sp.]|uniref:Ref family recombination enhancement nuclease n=1 Tax=Stenotrophomonas sp. TaxID=69392 RepID=UPI0028AC82B1|nr:Ref family recombination enhancement nuclease [Stenotrophomonas sp.]
MRRGRSTGKLTVAQQARIDAITYIGCIVAKGLGISFGDVPVPAEVHHLTVGGKHGQKRRGHDFTVGLNPWSHRGEPFGGMSSARCEELFGPSYAKQPRRFRQEIGNDDYLLDLQNTLIEQHLERTSWRPAA